MIFPLDAPSDKKSREASSRRASFFAGAGVPKFLTVDLERDKPETLSNPPSRKIKRTSIRLVIFNEADQRLLYDTETIINVEDSQHKDARRSKCGRFQFLRHRKDVTQLARMIFGTLSNSTRKSSMKIHTFANSVVLSRVFAVPKQTKLNSSLELKILGSSYGSDIETTSDYYATIRSLDTFRDSHRPKKNSSDPPAVFQRVRNASLQLDGSVVDEMRAFSPNQLSRARRKQLSLRGLASEGWDSRSSRLSSCCSSFNEVDDTKQLGFALIFPMDEKDFIFQHILQIEEEVNQLESAIRCTSVAKSNFFQNVYAAYCRFGESVCLLHNSARLRTPVWLSLQDAQIQNETARQFCRTLASLIGRLERRETNFFLSTLLSTVLMNHLAWIASVATPADAQTHENRSLLIGTNLMDNRKNPYNARMAQFMELCGSIGAATSRFAKTVIVGENRELIDEILFVLSYFIRCSNVEQKRPVVNSPVFQSQNSDEMDGRPAKRHSSSMAIPRNRAENHLESELFVEPPKKTRVVTGSAFRLLKPSSSQKIELMIDVYDVSTVLRPDLPFSTSLPANAFDSPTPSSSTSSSAMTSPNSTQRDLSRSLFAGICDSYSPYFILSGVYSNQTEEVNAQICEDVKRNFVRPAFLSTLSPSSSTYSPFTAKTDTPRSQDGSLEEMPNTTDTVVILGDLNCCVVRVISADSPYSTDESFVAAPSECIVSMLEQFAALERMNSNPNFLISFLEDRLNGILEKSNTLVELVITSPDTSDLITEQLKHMGRENHEDAMIDSEQISGQRVSTIIGCDYSDLRLILNVAAVYSPTVLSAAI
ncbi:hypothetical protein M3Y98_00762700 [Aphelenchoides besseyi]|nr:hypothetical protein M3Y98_00762700 [Aphelenchoides besseyi]KAI6211660.1 hypothetical protein M3Y96_00457700 [Aphelenchoides besseyi]